MDTAYEAKIQRFANYYLDSYHQIVQDKLIDQGADSVEKLVTLFNYMFSGEQKVNKWRLHPDSIKDGNVTCEVAALLCSVWFSMTTGNLTVFVEHNCERTEAIPHVEFGFVQSSDKLPLESIRESYDSIRKNHPLHGVNQQISWLHWLSEVPDRLHQPKTAMSSYTLLSGQRELLYKSIKRYGLPKTNLAYKKQNI